MGYRLKMSYPQFKAKWLGRVTNVDGFAGYQCVDLPKQYLVDTLGARIGGWGNAVDYAYSPARGFMQYVRKVKSPQQGDIVVFTWGRLGHIAIVDRVSGGSLTILEQNGGTGSASGYPSDRIRTRTVNKSLAHTYYRPKVKQGILSRLKRPRKPKKPKKKKTVFFKKGNTTYATIQRGWGLSMVAKQAGFKDWAKRSRWDAIAKLNGKSSYKKLPLDPGQKIIVDVDKPKPKPAPKPVKVEVQEDPPTPKAEPVKQPAVTPPVAEKPTSHNVNEGLTPFKDTFAYDPYDYVANTEAVITDIAGLQPDIMLREKVLVRGAGTFKHKGVLYVRTETSLDNGWWYGIPAEYLDEREVGDDDNEDDDDELFTLDMSMDQLDLDSPLTFREKLVNFVALIQGKLIKGFSAIRRKNK